MLLHCDQIVEDKLESSSDWTTSNQTKNLVELLKLIRAITHKHGKVKQGMMSYVEQDFDWKLYIQKENKALADFYKVFKARANRINTFSGQAGYHPKLFKKHYAEPTASLGKHVIALTPEEKELALQAACEEFKAS